MGASILIELVIFIVFFTIKLYWFIIKYTALSIYHAARGAIGVMRHTHRVLRSIVHRQRQHRAQRQARQD